MLSLLNINAFLELVSLISCTGKSIYLQPSTPLHASPELVKCLLLAFVACEPNSPFHVLSATFLWPVQLIEGAEAKAFYGLALNYKPLQALVERLLVKETLSGKEVAETLEGAGVHHFPDSYVEGFLWGEDGGLRYPGMPTQACPCHCQSIPPDLSWCMLSLFVIEAPSRAVRLCAHWRGSCAVCRGSASRPPSAVHILDQALTYMVNKAESCTNPEVPYAWWLRCTLLGMQDGVEV